MTELLIMACLVASPLDCEERALVFFDITPHTCLIAAQPHLAQWSTQNPAYSIKGWKCRWARVGERDT